MGIKREAEKQQAIQLRLEGKSYNEIRRTLGVRSKGTISYWLKGIQLSSTAKTKLQKNIQKAHDRGFLKFNTDRSARILRENEDALEEGKREVETLKE